VSYYSIYLELTGGTSARLRMRLDFYEICPQEICIGKNIKDGEFVEIFYINSTDSDNTPSIEKMKYNRETMNVKDLGVTLGEFAPKRKMKITGNARLLDSIDEEFIYIKLNDCSQRFAINVKLEAPIDWEPTRLVADYSTSESMSFIVYSPLNYDFILDAVELKYREKAFKVEMVRLNSTAYQVTITWLCKFRSDELPCLNSLKLDIAFKMDKDAIATSEQSQESRKSLWIPFCLIDLRTAAVSYTTQR